MLFRNAALHSSLNNRRNFVLNSIYIDTNEVMPWDEEYSEFPRKINDFIAKRGGIRHTFDFSEAGVSGASFRCASLFLD